LALLLIAAGIRPSPPIGPAPCRPAVTPRRDISRGLPESFYDQGRASLPAMYPRHRLLAERRDGRIGNVQYALLAFQTAPEDSVTLQAVAVDWTRRNRAWDLDARCPADEWSGGLIAMLEAIAALSAAGPQVTR
jgi:hypothetical protein